MAIEQTDYGFRWIDHTGKVSMVIERACSSDAKDRRRWTALRVRTETEVIDIVSMPRNTTVTRKCKP